MALLDTTVLVDLGRRAENSEHQRVLTALRTLLSGGEGLFTSRINEAEFRVGPEMSDQRQRELDRVQRVLAGIAILEFDALSAKFYAAIKASAFKSGRPIGDCDTMIAAVCLANGQLLLTRNGRHFQHVPGLSVRGY